MPKMHYIHSRVLQGGAIITVHVCCSSDAAHHVCMVKQFAKSRWGRKNFQYAFMISKSPVAGEHGIGKRQRIRGIKKSDQNSTKTAARFSGQESQALEHSSTR